MNNELCFVNLGILLRKNPNAVAYIKGSENYPDIRGRIMFYQMPCGVIVCCDIKGLPKGDNHCNNSIFAFHIHAGGSCSASGQDPFANAQGHYNPNNCLHPYHAGDLPPLFGANGRAFFAVLTNRFSVSEILGKTVIIHSNIDDFSTQPSGNAGEKMACGVIKR